MTKKAEAFVRSIMTGNDFCVSVDDLAAAAGADRMFPKDGNSDAVRVHLRMQLADGNTFQASAAVAGNWDRG